MTGSLVRRMFYSDLISSPEDIAHAFDRAARCSSHSQGINIDQAVRHDMRYALRGLLILQQRPAIR